MNLELALDDRRGYEWARYPRPVGALYQLLHDGLPTGVRVEHCGHPTANYPYALILPDGSLVLAPNGRAFKYLKDAKRAAEKVVT